MPDYIDGIFNYCDRWCERCPLTAHCRQFAMEQLMTRRSDIQNAEFWKELDLHLPTNPEFEELLEEADEEQEDESFVPDDPFDTTEENRFDRVQRSPLTAAAFDYSRAVTKWLATNRVQNSEPRADKLPTIDRADALDIIEWYSLQITAKLARAAGGQFDLDDDAGYEVVDDEEPEADEDLEPLWEDEPEAPWEDDLTRTLRDARQSDRDGSAKVALIGIERSLGALTLLRQQLPGEETAIRGLVKQLARLRVEIDCQWPGARTFIRPGFDDE